MGTLQLYLYSKLFVDVQEPQKHTLLFTFLRPFATFIFQMWYQFWKLEDETFPTIVLDLIKDDHKVIRGHS